MKFLYSLAGKMALLTLTFISASVLCFAQWSDMNAPFQGATPGAMYSSWSETAYLDGKLYVFGGSAYNDATKASSYPLTAWSLDVTTPGSSWKSIASMPSMRIG